MNKNASILNQKFKVGDVPTSESIPGDLNTTDSAGLFKVVGTGVPTPTVPEWFQGETVDQEPGVQENKPVATLSDLFKRYRSIDDQMANLKSQIALLNLQLAPLSLALQDQQELIDNKLKEQGIEKGKLEGYAYTYTKSTKTVIIDEDLIPDECWTPKPDANKIKKFLQNIPATDQAEFGAQLLTSKSLSIKQLTDEEDD